MRKLTLIVLASIAVGVAAGLVISGRSRHSGPQGVRRHRSTAPQIVAAGDISCLASLCAKDTANLFVGRSARLDPSRVLALGDNQYQCGAPSKYRSHYDRTWGRKKSITWPTPGNHDYYTNAKYRTERDCAGQDTGPNAAGGYFGYFRASANSPAQASCTGGCNGWYYHDIDANGDGRADWRLIALNTGACGELRSNNPPRCSEGSSQERWLKSVALANPPTCILAYWHHPRYTSPTTVHKDNRSSEQFWQDLYRARADVVVNAHVHTYQRSVPLKPNGGTGQEDDSNGIVEFIAGTGGAKLHSFTAKGLHDRRFAARNETDHGVLELTLHPSSYDWTFVPVSGSYSDRGSAHCHT